MHSEVYWHQQLRGNRLAAKQCWQDVLDSNIFLYTRSNTTRSYYPLWTQSNVSALVTSLFHFVKSHCYVNLQRFDISISYRWWQMIYDLVIAVESITFVACERATTKVNGEHRNGPTTPKETLTISHILLQMALSANLTAHKILSKSIRGTCLLLACSDWASIFCSSTCLQPGPVDIFLYKNTSNDVFPWERALWASWKRTIG